MTGILISWLVLSFVVWLTAVVLPGFEVRGFGGAAIVAAIFGVLNWLLGWLLFTVFGLATLGIGFLLAFITHWLVNAVLLKLTDALSRSLTIRSFGHALVGAAIIGVFSTLTHWALGRLGA